MVAPATAYDAKGLMTAAIRDENPVIFLEYKYLYRRIKGDVPEDLYEVPIGKGEVRRDGTDVTVISYGSTVHFALEAASRLALEEGIETRVVDLRSLVPLDVGLILDSVKATGKVLIVHEANLTGGVGAEISALIASNAFAFLDAPVMRLAGLDTPVPFAPTLEEYVLPNTEKIAQAIRTLARY
jgi:2-oxoisovalerate dehydrogenase E1 component beta subunit